MSKQYKVGDVVLTKQDHYEEYQGQISEIKRMPHPNSNSDKLLTFYRIEYIFKKGSFLTCDKSLFQ